jgi:hypothetical protein
LLIFIPSSTPITSYDCSGSVVTQKTISSVDTPECVEKVPNLVSQDITIQLIQPKDMEEIDFIRCNIITHHHIFRCGKSIDTHHDGGLYSENIELSHEECRKIHDLKSYKYPTSTGFLEINVKLNRKNSYSATTIGSIDHSGSCTTYGSFHANGRVYERAVRQTTFEVYVSKEVGRLSVDDKTLIIPNGNKFDFFSGSGFSADFGYLFWNVNFKRIECTNEDRNFMVLYQGIATKLIETSDEIGGAPMVSYIFTINSDYSTQIYLQNNINPSGVCGLRVLRTEHPKLSIVEKIDGVDFTLKFTQISSLDVNLATYFNAKLLHVVRHSKTEVDRLFKLFSYERCKSENRITHNLLTLSTTNSLEFAYNLMQGPGYTAATLGEVIYISKCRAVEVQYHPQPEVCFKELPVLFKNTTMFMQPRTKVLLTTGTEVDCSAGLPPLFKINGLWYIPTQHGLMSTSSPEIIVPSAVNFTFKVIKNLAEGGVYTSDAIEKMQRILLSPMEQTVLTAQVIRTFEGKSTLPQGMAASNTFRAADIEYIEGKMTGWFSSVYKNLSTWGSICSFVLSCWLGFRFIKSILNAFINAIIIRQEFGISWYLMFACWENMVHICLNRRMHETINKRRQNPSREPGDVELGLLAPSSPPDEDRHTTVEEPTSDQQKISALQAYFEKIRRSKDHV